LKIQHIAGVDRPANKRRFLVVKQEQIDKTVKLEGGKFCAYDAEGDKIGEYDTQAEAEQAVKMHAKKGRSIMLEKEQLAKIKEKEIQEAIVAQQEEMVELEKKVAKLEEQLAEGGTSKSDDDEAVWKGIPPAIRNRFDAIKKERDNMEATAKREKDEREVNVWTQKCAQFKYLQITPEHFGKVMKKAAEAGTAEVDEIMRVLSAADHLIEKGTVFMEYGRTNTGVNGSAAGDATDVVARVQALAGDYVKLDKTLTPDKAIEKVFADHPDWYPMYKKQSQIQTAGRD